MPTATITAKYSSKIIKAGALLADTKTLLAYWDTALSVTKNLDRFQRENLFGKGSRSRIEDILAIFKQRYLRDPSLLQALVVFAQAGFPTGSFDRILYFLALQADLLLHDAVTDLVKPVYERGQPEITVGEMTTWVRQQCDEGRTQRAWGDETVTRVAQGIMATLRDFGVLQGLVHKIIVPPHLPSTAFSFLALLRHRELRSGDRLIHDPAWQVFFLSELAVERYLIEAHQEHLLEYYAAGRVVRITFPTESLEQYAHTLSQRAH